jgi:hypothetical protein
MEEQKKKRSIGKIFLKLIAFIIFCLILIFWREIYTVYAIIDINNKVDKLEAQINTEGSFKIFTKELNNNCTYYSLDDKVRVVNEDLLYNLDYEYWVYYDEDVEQKVTVRHKPKVTFNNEAKDLYIKSLWSLDDDDATSRIRIQFQMISYIDVTSDSFIDRIKNTLQFVERIKTVNLEPYGKVYYVRTIDGYCYISKETGFPMSSSDATYYTLTIGGLTEDDIEIPNPDDVYILLLDNRQNDSDTLDTSNEEEGTITDYSFKISNDESGSLAYFKESENNDNLRITKATSQTDFNMITKKWSNVNNLAEIDFDNYFALIILDTNNTEEISYNDYQTLETENETKKLVTLDKTSATEDYKYSGTLLVVPNSMDVSASGLTIMGFDANFTSK